MIAELLGWMLVTAYTLTGTTASGAQTGYGVAACPPSMPFGTQLLIETKPEVGGIQVVCLDRYAPYLSDRLDVWAPDLKTAYALTGTYRVLKLQA